MDNQPDTPDQPTDTPNTPDQPVNDKQPVTTKLTTTRGRGRPKMTRLDEPTITSSVELSKAEIAKKLQQIAESAPEIADKLHMDKLGEVAATCPALEYRFVTGSPKNTIPQLITLSADKWRVIAMARNAGGQLELLLARDWIPGTSAMPITESHPSDAPVKR